MSEKDPLEVVKGMVDLGSKANPEKWMIGGPYPSTSIYYETSPACISGGPDNYCEAEGECIAMLDGRQEGEPNKQAQADAAFMVAAANARPSLTALITEVERLRAVAAKLPKTADGVAVVPSDLVYHEPSPGDVRVFKWSDWWSEWRGITKCYSTQAAAEAARGGGK